MIAPQQLLNDLKAELKKLEDDLRERGEALPEVRERLQAEHQAARAAGRTASTFAEWREHELTQAAVAWILAGVFVRFLEDNGLLDHPWLSGPGDQLRAARDQHDLFFAAHPTETGREYLLHVFSQVAALPGLADLYDPRHNPLYRLAPSGDGANALIAFWQHTSPDTGALAHDFTDPDWDTRFLGDLYQDLSASARQQYALLQTPEFVERFILDRTLEPAIQEVGLAEVTLMDPACGSGHFLLGAFRRLLRHWQHLEPGTNPPELARRALAAVHGVDLNPFAVAIARFRLLIEANRVVRAGESKWLLRYSPDFHLNLAVGDSLLHGPPPGSMFTEGAFDLFAADHPLKHPYAAEDPAALRRLLGRKYHVVVGNPPYITVKDHALSEAYRASFASCHRKYALVCPFLERFMDLGIASSAPYTKDQMPDTSVPAHVGLIVANSFMKREFGKKLIEEVLPLWDLTHVIDTSGAYIPGHGTPTCILLLRQRAPVASSVRAVMGIKGEPGTPADPARGEVWSAILDQVDRPGSASIYVSSDDVPRERFQHHPWSLQGGGASGVTAAIEGRGEIGLGDLAASIGFASFTGTDDAFVASATAFLRVGIQPTLVKTFLPGDALRDWIAASDSDAVVPYDEHLAPLPLTADAGFARYIWPCRTTIGGTLSFGGRTRLQEGGPWWTWYRWVAEKYRTRLTIAYGEVATHNHFVLDRGGKVFKQTAPVIKLPAGATEDQHLELLGLLNSSTACFWLKQMVHCKGAASAEVIRSEAWEPFWQYNATKLKQFPLPKAKPLALARELDRLGQELAAQRPAAVIRRWNLAQQSAAQWLAEAQARFFALRARMIFVQEELDWQCYGLYGLTSDPHLSALSESGEVSEDQRLALGERAFELALARSGTETTWFTRHGSTPLTALPAQWSAAYRAVVAARLAEIATNAYVRMIEKPEYKRRWQLEPWEHQVQAALREWLLNRLEFVLSGRDLMREADHAAAAVSPQESAGAGDERWTLVSCAQLADRVRGDAEFLGVAEVYTGQRGCDVARLVTELVESDGVPALPRDRYRPTGWRKRQDWEATWALQRREDAGETGLDLPVPPKYASTDFRSATYWKLRGKLDVPKERFILYPGAERDGDPSPVLTWAGWDHRQQARAVAAWYEARKREGWSNARLLPVLAALVELLPWLRQWHNAVDPAYGLGLGDFFATYAEDEARQLGTTVAQLREAE